MQIYALDKANRLIMAQHALKQQDYRCLECQARVRLRRGLHRQSHFYHLEPNRHCHLSGKGMVHLEVQHFICRSLGAGECLLEHRFAEIGRIADVAWPSQRLIFEVQCASISAQEVLQRNRDYRSIGWEVVWILHDQRYNQWRCTAAEWALRSSSTHYFTNVNKEGQGIIYDQFDHVEGGIRKDKMAPLPLDLKSLRRLGKEHRNILKLIEQRLKQWTLSFHGDLIDLSLNSPLDDYVQAAQRKERSHVAPSSSFKWFKLIFYKWIARPYTLLFQMLLEKVCK